MKLDPEAHLRNTRSNYRTCLRWGWWRTATVLAATLVIVSHLATNALVNVGSLALARSALDIDAKGSEAQSERLLEWAQSRFEQALILDTNEEAAQWGLVRTGLALEKHSPTEKGNAQTTANILSKLTNSNTNNPLLFQDTLVALGRADRFDEVITFYESKQPLAHTQTVSDTVALAYLQRNKQDDLLQALTFRPAIFI